MLELEHGFRVVDTHVQLDPEADSARSGRPFTPDRLEREMQQAGIVRAVVFPGAAPDTLLRANNAVARHTVDRPFVAFARINGPRDPAMTPAARLKNLATSRGADHVSPDDIERYGYDDRFHGFVLAPGRDGLPDEAVLDRLEAVGLPLIVQYGGVQFPPAAIEATLLGRSFHVTIAHCGGYPLRREHMWATLELLNRHECAVDTSAVRFRDVLERAMREHPDRILFGSGAPDVHPSVGVMELLTLDVSEDALRKAFSNNPERVIPRDDA